MKRIRTQPRANWPSIVESQGFHFHSPDDKPYWDESACYILSSAQVDQLEAATLELDQMCLRAVQHVIDQDLFDLFQIPQEVVPWITQSWDNDATTLYGRFDFAYDGVHPPRLLEFNADTPTALLEAAVIQWYWLQDVIKDPAAFSPQIPPGVKLDQFNSIHERLIEAWQAFGASIQTLRAAHPQVFNPTMYFSSLAGNLEDFMTVSYLRDTATQAGLQTQYIEIEALGIDHRRTLFVDMAARPIHNIFKLYPWEWMVRESFAPFLRQTRVNWIEPPWKMILSNKAILPILHQLFPQSPYILPASFEPLAGPYVRKPILSREGANIAMVIGGKTIIETPGPYTGPCIYQQLTPLPDNQGNLPVIGSWLVNGNACGIGIREDTSPITGNTSRFVPHLFLG